MTPCPLVPTAAVAVPPCMRQERAERPPTGTATGEIGYLHSVFAGSTVDGPGVRTVVWTTGCALRCLYCHNPDSWKMHLGERTTADQVVREVVRYRSFMEATGGGVTVSGGEPAVQAPFVSRILRACHREGLHTTLDTCGFLTERFSDQDLEHVDLVLLDIKSWLPETHRHVTGREVEPVLHFARRLADLGKPAWIRFVLVPGLTDAPENVEGLAAFAAALHNVERVEVLPFHQMGRDKWERLGRPYPLADTEPPSDALLARVQEQFRAYGLETH